MRTAGGKSLAQRGNTSRKASERGAASGERNETHEEITQAHNSKTANKQLVD
jgi:hypothetical protein